MSNKKLSMYFMTKNYDRNKLEFNNYKENYKK